MRLEGRVAVVTGSGVGIGRGIAERFAKEKATVAVADINLDTAKAVAKSITDAGGTALPFAVDVSDTSAVFNVMNDVASQFGQIDILVNNAGIRYLCSFLETSREDWQRTLDVNLTGPFLCMKAAIPHMLKRGKGKIVNVASVAGFFGRPLRSAYCASKGGMIALTKAAAVDMREKNICINALAPALIETPFNASFAENPELASAWGKEIIAGRWGQPSDVAGAALFLASDDSDFITGSVVTVDGGWTSSLIRTRE